MNRRATSIWNGLDPSKIGNARPNAPARFASLTVAPAAIAASSRAIAFGCRPSPNSALICSAVTVSPTAKPRLGSPEPTH